tara:strand:- start:183 stop:707 length:525 start_codon:yes stop_codon:yes gene_type:complete
MPGSLVKIDELTLSSPTASVTLTGIDSTYDVYMVRVSNVQPVTDNKNFLWRVTKSGTAQSDSEYDFAGINMYTHTSFGNTSGTNATSNTFAHSCSNVAGETVSATLYLFNFPNASEYSYATIESAWVNATPNSVGMTSGLVHTVASASDGVHFFMESSVNINTGAQFALYGLKK